MKVCRGQHSSAGKIGESAARAVPMAAGGCLSAEKLDGLAVKLFSASAKSLPVSVLSCRMALD